MHNMTYLPFLRWHVVCWSVGEHTSRGFGDATQQQQQLSTATSRSQQEGKDYYLKKLRLPEADEHAHRVATAFEVDGIIRAPRTPHPHSTNFCVLQRREVEQRRRRALSGWTSCGFQTQTTSTYHLHTDRWPGFQWHRISQQRHPQPDAG